MKKNILKTTALFIILSGLLNSCTLLEDDSPSEIVTAVTTKSEAAKKAVLSLSVAEEGEARTALPSVSSAQEFESFDFEANKGTDRITKSWTGDSEKTAYAKMTSESFEIDAGIWTLTLTAKKGGMTYKGSVEKEITADANSIEFTLSLAELSNEGKGSVEIKLSVPQSVIAVTATLCNTSENEVSDSSITQSTDLANNIVNYSAQNLPSGTYLVVFSLYADTSKTLLLGKWREYVGITYGATSKSEITIAADDLDKVYTITYELNGGTLKGNWAGNYTRQNLPLRTPSADDFESRPSEFLGWYTDENLTNEFNSASLIGKLTLYARWKTISVDELISKINDGTIGEKAVLGGEIISENLISIATVMKETECYLALDLSMTKGLTSIGDKFKNCKYLTGISIPKTVTSIGFHAFSGCSGLESVTIPEGVTSIGCYAFSGCSGLESVTIPSSVTSIVGYAFYGCSGLESVTIPSSVTSIGESAFYGCSGLESVTIPSSVTSIGESAFYGCSELESVTIPEGVTSIGCYAFSGCSGLTNVTIPSSLTNIVSYAFSGCSGLESVTIPEGVTRIGDRAFYGCSGLESVTIPSSVTSIGESVFSGCTSITEMTIPFVGYKANASGSRALFGYIFGNNEYEGGTATKMYYSFSDSSVFYIPSSLKIVTVAGGILKYGAFSGCSGLESVTIPSSVSSIGESAFSGCSGLESVTIPSSVTSIGKSVFSGCSGLKSVTIPRSVTSIGEWAFSGCSGLKSVYYGGTLKKWLAISFASNPCCTGSDLYIQGKKITDLVIPEGEMSIGESAFYGCSGLESVTIPSSVTSIGDRAFSRCSGLKSVYYDGTLDQWLAISFASNPCCNGSDLYIQGKKITDLVIPEGEMSIGKSAFSGCSGLESVTIPSSVTSIGDSAFSGCSGLESVTIPEGVTSIGFHAFSECSGLESVTIPSSVTSIVGYAFSGCSGLKSVTIPSSVTSIGDRAFSRCSGLKSVTIPSSVTSIGNSAFSGCSGLESVMIPSSVTSIGSYAFNVCNKLTSLTCFGENSWTVGDRTGITLTASNVRDKYYDKVWTRKYNPGTGSDSGSTQIGNVSNLRCTYLNMTKGSRKIILTWSGNATSLSFKFNGYTVNQKNVDFSANEITLYEKDGDGGEYSVYCPNLGNSNRFVFIVDSESINVNF